MNTNPPAEMLNLEHLRGQLAQMRLVEYLFSCSRVPNEYYLPPPPPNDPLQRFERGSKQETMEIERVLKAMENCYRNCVFMLGDAKATENEQWRLAQHAAFVHMQNFLPKYTWRDVKRFTKPANIDRADYLFLINQCEGKFSSDEEECLFIGEDGMYKFIAYMQSKK